MVRHSVNWTDDSGISGYVFSWYNGANWTLMNEKTLETEVVQKMVGVNDIADIPTSCRDTGYASGQNFELYSMWTTPGSGEVRVTGLRLYDSESAISGTESVQMALYNDSGDRISDVITVTGAGSQQWLMGELPTPVNITLGESYTIGVGPYGGSVYAIAQDTDSNCASYPPTGEPSWYEAASGELNDNVPASQHPSNKFIIWGLEYDAAITEENSTYSEYENIDSDHEKILNITVTIEVDSYNPEASVNHSNDDPDMELEIYNGTDFVSIGLFNLNLSYSGDTKNTTNANFTITITDPVILESWKAETNQDLRIKGISMDYKNKTVYDEINYTGPWIHVNHMQEFLNDSWIEMMGYVNWSNVTKVVNSTLGSVIRWRVYANDTSNNWNVTEEFTYVTTADTTPPNSSFLTVNESFPKTEWYVKFSARWEDSLTYLDEWVFEWNLTSGGDWENVSYGSFSGNSGWSNTTMQIPVYANASYGFRFYANDTEGNMNVTDTGEFTISGFMDVEIIDPLNTKNVALNATFLANATVTCRNGTCGTVSGRLMHNSSSLNPDTDVPVTESTPFYIMSETNPEDCFTNPLENNEYCNVTWTVNTTGDIGSVHSFGMLFESGQNNVYDNHTGNNTVTIVSCIMDMTLNWDSMDFGVLAPLTTANPAPGNPTHEYNITIEDLTTCGIDIYINSSELRHSTQPSYFIPQYNITFNNETNDFMTGYNLTDVWDVIKPNTQPGSNVTTYYWINAPHSILHGSYTGIITIKGVEHGTEP
jgi:hypothetical protein